MTTNSVVVGSLSWTNGEPDCYCVLFDALSHDVYVRPIERIDDRMYHKKRVFLEQLNEPCVCVSRRSMAIGYLRYVFEYALSNDQNARRLEHRFCIETVCRRCECGCVWKNNEGRRCKSDEKQDVFLYLVNSSDRENRLGQFSIGHEKGLS